MLRNQIFSRKNGGFEAKTRRQVWSRLVAESAAPGSVPVCWAMAGSIHSDVYDNWVNPIVAGNSGGINASCPPVNWLKQTEVRSDTLRHRIG
jgi:hypothetical protein